MQFNKLSWHFSLQIRFKSGTLNYLVTFSGLLECSYGQLDLHEIKITTPGSINLIFFVLSDFAKYRNSRKMVNSQRVITVYSDSLLAGITIHTLLEPRKNGKSYWSIHKILFWSQTSRSSSAYKGICVVLYSAVLNRRSQAIKHNLNMRFFIYYIRKCMFQILFACFFSSSIFRAKSDRNMIEPNVHMKTG